MEDLEEQKSGVCYRLYTEKIYNYLKAFPEPAIRTSNIYEECLKLISLSQIRTINKLLDTLTQFIEPPKEKYHKNSINTINIIEINRQRTNYFF